MLKTPAYQNLTPTNTNETSSYQNMFHKNALYMLLAIPC